MSLLQGVRLEAPNPPPRTRPTRPATPAISQDMLIFPICCVLQDRRGCVAVPICCEADVCHSLITLHPYMHVAHTVPPWASLTHSNGMYGLIIQPPSSPSSCSHRARPTMPGVQVTRHFCRRVLRADRCEGSGIIRRCLNVDPAFLRVSSPWGGWRCGRPPV